MESIIHDDTSVALHNMKHAEETAVMAEQGDIIFVRSLEDRGLS